ncbi:MAG: restriction endonuclease [Nitrososphaerales archaeon]|nr:restriction endonuclease [Nitrososphaerales archaeon]
MNGAASIKGALLEDAVANLFRNWGFDTEVRCRLKDRFDVSHEIDVLASKTEVFGTIKIAIECKNVKSPIDIKELRNFHDKLRSLGLTKGIFISTGGFTSEAKSHAKALGIELWDLETLQRKLEEVRIQGDKVDNALEIKISKHEISNLQHLLNPKELHLAELKLEFYPYYFVSYDCFSQHKLSGNIVNIESRGIVVIDAIFSNIVDSIAEGVQPFLPRGIGIADLSKLEPRSLSVTDLKKEYDFDHVIIDRPKLTPFDARRLAQRELVKDLRFEYKHARGVKVLTPLVKDTQILDCRIINIPMISASFRAKERIYRRIVQGASKKEVLDESKFCSICKLPSMAVCEGCGSIVCRKHWRRCESCGKNLCSECVILKGLILKKYYCKTCKNP